MLITHLNIVIGTKNKAVNAEFGEHNEIHSFYFAVI
jgi:hypothetical protein